MQNEEIMNDGKNVFLRRKMEEDYELGFEVKMIIQNEPDNLLKLHISRESNQIFLDYNITNLTSLEECEAGEKLQYLYAILSALSRLADECNAYLLLPGKIDLTPEHIFLEKEEGKVYFRYCPESNGSVPDNIRQLMEYFIKNSNPVKEEDVLLVYGLYRKSREEHITLKTPLEYWKNARSIEKREGGTTNFYFGNEAENAIKEGKEPALSGRQQWRDYKTYEKLGMDVPDGDDSFNTWKQNRKPSYSEEWYPGENTGNSFCKTTEDKPVDGRKEGGFARFRKLFKGKIPEISIGFIAFTVSMIYILCG